MRGRMTVTVNTSGDICAIQKAGGVGVMQSLIMQCLRIASVKAADITSKIKNSVSFFLLKSFADIELPFVAALMLLFLHLRLLKVFACLVIV